MGKAAPAGWFPRRGEVYLAGGLGAKTRPAIVLSTDALNRFSRDVCIVPLTTVQHAEFSLRIPIPAREGGLARDSWAKCDQVCAIEKRGLIYPMLGRLSASTLRRIEDAVRTALGL